MKTRRRKPISRRPAPGAGFTLVELLVVILIIGLVSAATLPVILPALSHRQVGEGSRLLQATLVGARDAAIRANAPRGIRLLPDPAFPGGSASGTLAANRMISIEPAPDYTTGRVSIYASAAVAPNNIYYAPGNLPTLANSFDISVLEEIWSNPTTVSTPGNTIPNEPTSWYWNIRQGDRIRFDDSGNYYTVAGPMLYGPSHNGSIANVERYVNFGLPGFVPNAAGASVQNNPDPFGAGHFPEILFLVNGVDDDGDGWIDEAFDGIDNDGDGVVDPGYNGIDDDGVNGIDDPGELTFRYTNGVPGSGEYEPEKFLSDTVSSGSFLSKPFTIFRRPVVSEGAREVALPQGVVIDMTTWNSAQAVFPNSGGTPVLVSTRYAPPFPERSRLPIDPFSYTVDIMIGPNGQVVPSGAGTGQVQTGATSSSPTSALPFYHFWIAERDDVMEPLWGVHNPTTTTTTTVPLLGAPIVNMSYNPGQAGAINYLLPMPQGTTSIGGQAYVGQTANGPFLKGDRRLVTLSVKTGQVVTNEVETFDVTNTNAPYYSAQFGTREAK